MDLCPIIKHTGGSAEQNLIRPLIEDRHVHGTINMYYYLSTLAIKLT
jgi:hypothetical protein